MNACSVVTAQPSPAVTESRRGGVSLLCPTVPQRLSSRPSRRIERAFTRQRQRSDTAFNHLCLTRFVSGAGEVGSPRSMPPTGRATPWDGYIDLVSRPPACNALQQRSSFSCRFVYQNPPRPHPKIGCNITNGSDPEARQVMNTVLEFRPAESPISCPRDHIAHVGMIRLEAALLAGAQRSSFPVCIRPVRERTVQTREPLVSLR